jgi:hypothetical protein
MKKTIILVTLMIAASIAVFGQTNSDSTQTENDKKEVIALANELSKAKINFDATVIERIIADDFKETSPVDGEMDKARLIELYKGMQKEMQKVPPPIGERIISYKSSYTEVSFYGNTAIFNERQEFVIQNFQSGKKSIDGADVSMVAVKRNGRWAIVFWTERPDQNYRMQKNYTNQKVTPTKTDPAKKLKKP